MTAAPATSPLPLRLRALVVLALVATVVAGYYNSLGVPLLLDDPTTILNNPSIRQLSPIGSVLFPPPGIYTAGRPLLNLSFALNYAWGETSVGGYHVVNAVIHALAGLVLFGLLRRTLTRPVMSLKVRESATPLALVIAMLWLAQPVQTASVTYISQRAESLMALFYLLTLYGWVRAATGGHKAWLGVSVAACACGMATKEVMVTAPLLILLFDRQFISGTFREAWQRHHRAYFALAATWLILLGLMLHSQVSERGVGTGELSPVNYACIETRAWVHYLRISLWPDPLVFDFGPRLAVPAGAELAVRTLLLGLLATGSLIAFARGKAAGFACFAFCLLLVPSSSIVPVAGQPIAENRVYLPLAFALSAAVVGLFAVLGQRGSVFAIATLLPAIWMTHERNATYRSELGLWADTVQKQPYNTRAWVMLSVTQIGLNQPEAAISTLLTAARLMPENAEFQNNIGVYYYRMGRMPDAAMHLQEAIRLKPDYPAAQSSLGRTLLEAKDMPGAANAFAALIRLEPDNADAHNFLGVALFHLGRQPEAMAEFETALKLRPGFLDAQNNLAIMRGEKR